RSRGTLAAPATRAAAARRRRGCAAAAVRAPGNGRTHVAPRRAAPPNVATGHARAAGRRRPRAAADRATRRRCRSWQRTSRAIAGRARNSRAYGRPAAARREDDRGTRRSRGYATIRGSFEVALSMPVRSKWQSLPTEAINPATLAIDKLSPGDIVEGMLNEDRKMLAAVHREKDRIAVGIEIITQALRRGGRIIFVGAGTSGRLGVLESAEMPPTFGTPEVLVQAIMAGGKDAVMKSREGVEDNYEEGARSINRLRPT